MTEHRYEFRVGVRFIATEDRGRSTLPGSPYKPGVNITKPDGEVMSMSVLLTFDRPVAWRADNLATMAILLDEQDTMPRVGDQLQGFEGPRPVVDIAIIDVIDRMKILAQSLDRSRTTFRTECNWRPAPLGGLRNLPDDSMAFFEVKLPGTDQDHETWSIAVVPQSWPTWGRPNSALVQLVAWDAPWERIRLGDTIPIYQGPKTVAEVKIVDVFPAMTDAARPSTVPEGIGTASGIAAVVP